jgi:transposase, IS30 family
MACHDQLAELIIDGVFFAYPGRPWERPLNENTNGRLRPYLSKHTDLSIHAVSHLRAVEDRLSMDRPREVGPPRDESPLPRMVG